jgi:pimeloyl-ACP methyl ester carboxylesterase
MPNCMSILLSAALLGLVPALAPSPAAAQTPAASGKTYVLVHGAWGGSWDWRKVDDLLTAEGNTVFRPSLTGLGARVHLATPDIGLGTHVQDVVNEILFENLRDVVLVGHSYGGMVISGVAEKVPDRIARLVYLDAFVPEDGESVMARQRAAGRAEWIEKMEKDGFLIPPWVQPGQPIPKDVPHPLKAFTEPLALKNEAARRLPATYILTMDKGKQTDDFSPHADRARARAWTVVQMEADHNPQRTMPDALVKLLRDSR